MRVLLVEDNPINAEFFVAAVEDEDVNVTVEREGEAGYDRALREPFDLIVLDVHLPGRTGIDIVRALRTRGVEIPILALSAAALPEEVRAGLASGFDAYLQKPISPSALREQLRVAHRSR